MRAWLPMHQRLQERDVAQHAVAKQAAVECWRGIGKLREAPRVPQDQFAEAHVWLQQRHGVGFCWDSVEHQERRCREEKLLKPLAVVLHA